MISNLDLKPIARFCCAGFASACSWLGALKALKTHPWEMGSIQGAQPLGHLQVAPAPLRAAREHEGSCLAV